jgi:hypothetical protein
MKEGEIYPAEDVQASANDAELQSTHRIEDLPTEQRDYLDELRADALARGASMDSEWIFFASPAWTWERECGREGWLLYDRKTGEQHSFLMTAMN